MQEILEASNRIGGRIRTVRENGLAMELGAGYIHHFESPRRDQIGFPRTLHGAACEAEVLVKTVPSKHWDPITHALWRTEKGPDVNLTQNFVYTVAESLVKVLKK